MLLQRLGVPFGLEQSLAELAIPLDELLILSFEFASSPVRSIATSAFALISDRLRQSDAIMTNGGDLNARAIVS